MQTPAVRESSNDLLLGWNIFLGTLATTPLLWFASRRCIGCRRRTFNRSATCSDCATKAHLREQAADAARRAEAEKIRREAELRAAEQRRRETHEREAERRRQEEERKREAARTIEGLQRLSGSEFEELISSLFKRDGYRITRCGGSGDDGIDVILHLESAKDVVQCKRWRNDIGAAVIREFYGSLMHAGARQGFVITTASFSVNARSFAAGKPIFLIDGKYLLAWANGSRSSRQENSRPRRDEASTDPYSVLGVPHGAARETIRAAYLTLIAKYHPDKVEALAPEYQEIARTRSQLINAAYERLKRRT